jgi:DHA2 family multidrug resistance protein-like MFS transporter
VAVLGSVAGVVYRGALPADDLAAQGVTGGSADVVRESLGGALDVASEAGTSGAGLAAEAQTAFTDSLVWASLAGGAVMVVTALAVWLMTPRDLDVSSGHD